MRADERLEMSGLKDAANKKISSYSGGMVQRLGIAQAMMGNPKVLFLDEPTSALDPIGRKEVLEFILKIKKSCTVFMSTHILSDVERVCDTVAIIDKGKVLVQEKTDVLKKKFSQKIIEVELSDRKDVERLKNIVETEKLGGIIKEEDYIVTIHPENFEKGKMILLEEISKMAIDIQRFEVLNASLEDVFVKLIGGQDEK
jgi:ABC-2 type transport system ATP-binding protein